jgi:endonuclease/exonuclease/phosphatase family metal-dependent hydrolase
MSTLTVATLNLRNRQDRWRERRHLVVAQILDTAPDLLSLQEVSRPMGQARWLRSQINSRMTGSAREPYHLLQERKHHFIKGFYEGIAILSKFPVISHDALSLGYEGRVALRANVALPSGQMMDFVNTHLHHVAYDREARQEQVMRLVGWLNSSGRAPLQVIAGDFNETPEGPAIQQMKQVYRSAFFQVRGYEPLATFPTALVDQADGWTGCLDYIFVSSNIKVTAAHFFCDKPAADDNTLYPSDHVGLVATLETEAT